MSTTRAIVRRDYDALFARFALAGNAPLLSSPHAREEAMVRAVTMLWQSFEHASLSWIGFYAKSDDADEMVLVCREPKPACSPIGLHGMCGRGWQERRPIVIPDIRTLGENYIACDPRDKSELVVPVMNADGSCWGVLDADSYDIAGFDEHDAAGMATLLERLGISAPISRESMRL